MTLLQMAMLDDRALVAADSRIGVGPRGGPFIRGTGKKLFEIGGCAVASFGENPPGLDVAKDFILSFTRDHWDPNALSYRIAKSIESLPARGAFGLLICGANGRHIELWEIPAESTKPVQLSLMPGKISTRGTTIADLDRVVQPTRDPRLLLANMLTVFRAACAVSEGIGAPYEIASVRQGRPLEVEIFDI